jgi:hypothetical protein
MAFCLDPESFPVRDVRELPLDCYISVTPLAHLFLPQVFTLNF